MAKINPDKKQIEYWQGRNERTFLEGEKDILDYAESLKKQYTGAANRIEEEIQKFYGKFAVDNNYTMADLKKLLNRDELKSFKESIKDIAAYAKEHKLDKDFETQIKILRAKSKISRLDELKTKINFEVEKLYSDVNDSLGEQLQKSFEDGYYKTIFNQQKFLGFSDNFAMLNQKAIQKAVTTPYMTENYSDVLWKNKTNLMNILNQQIPQGIILGYNPNKTAKIASQQLGSKYKSTARLIRTEYNLILNDATAQGYKEAGIEKYQILATLDSRTSDICRDMDGEIFKVKEKEVGVNYPPFHPNCRTTTIPYFEPDEFDTEIEQYIKDEDGIKHKITDDTQYEEWKNALKPKKDGTAIYENNLEPNDTNNLLKYGIEKVDLSKFKPEEQEEISNRLNKYVSEYSTNLRTVEGQGALQGKTLEAGHVDISGQKMYLSKGISKAYSTIDHEFAHTIAGNKYDKIQGQNIEFWKEIDSVKRKYKAELNAIDKKQIVEKSIDAVTANNLKDAIYIAGKNMDMNNYALTNLDEFMAVSFEFYKTGQSTSKYAKQVIDIIDKYFKRK